MNEDEQIVWGQPISFLDFVLGFLTTPNLRRVELVPKTDPSKFYTREKVAPPSQDLGEIRDANKERVNKSLSNYASNNFLLSTSNIRPDLNGRYNPGLGLFAGDLTALALSMGFDPFNASNYYKVATQIPKFRNWGLTRLLANELNNEVRVAGELGKNVGKSTISPIIRTKIGDVEINNPELYYHLSGLGKAKNFFNTNRMRTPQEEYWLKLEHVPLTLRTGVVPGFPQNPGRAMFSLGKLWYGLNPEQFPDLLVTAKEMPVANSKAGIVRGSLLKLESQGTRRVTSDNIDNIGPHTNQNTLAYTYVPGYGYRQIQLEPRTSLRFFERPLSRISETEKAGIPRGERNLPELKRPLKRISRNININFNFGNLSDYLAKAKAELRKGQERGLIKGEKDVFDYLGSEKHIKRIQEDGKTRKEAEAIAKEMKKNAMATDYNIGIPISQSSGNFGTVGEYDSGFGNVQKNWFGNPKYSFRPEYTVREGLSEYDTYRNVLHELGGHGASMGYRPNMYEHQKALQKYEDAMQEWFPHYKEVYNHNSSLKPVRKTEYINSNDSHLKYLEGVDEYSARARAENIKEGGEDFAELYKYFTKESVDKLKKGVWATAPIATAAASYANQQGLGRKQSDNKFYSGGNIIKKFKSRNK